MNKMCFHRFGANANIHAQLKTKVCVRRPTTRRACDEPGRQLARQTDAPQSVHHLGPLENKQDLVPK